MAKQPCVSQRETWLLHEVPTWPSKARLNYVWRSPLTLRNLRQKTHSVYYTAILAGPLAYSHDRITMIARSILMAMILLPSCALYESHWSTRLKREYEDVPGVARIRDLCRSRL